MIIDGLVRHTHGRDQRRIPAQLDFIDGKPLRAINLRRDLRAVVEFERVAIDWSLLVLRHRFVIDILHCVTPA